MADLVGSGLGRLVLGLGTGFTGARGLGLGADFTGAGRDFVAGLEAICDLVPLGLGLGLGLGWARDLVAGGGYCG